MSLIKRRNSDFAPSRFFDDDFFGFPTFFGRDLPGWNMRNMPPANITETNDSFIIDISAPGLQRSDFKVEVDENLLTISSEKKEESKDEKENYKRREFSYSSFSRSFQLPDNISDDKINAKFDNGVLHISIPKKEPGASRPKKTIDVG